MLETEDPSIVVVPESAVEVRCIASVAKKINIPTLGIQHGVLSSSNPTYNTNDAEMFPDITVVGGDYWKNVIVNNSKLPSDRVLALGIPRYDLLAKADEIFNKEKFFKKYKINPNHKIILWTTQCHGLSEEENIKNFKVVFETMQNLRDVTLIIKQHPGEGKRYTKMIEKYLNRYGIDAVITPKNSDIYEQLFVCDLLITKDSTTAMEIVALNKPIIVLNLSGCSDIIDYVGSGIALGIYKEEDLKSTEAVQQFKNGRKRKANMGLNPKRSKIFCAKSNCETASTIEKLLKDDSELAKNREKYIAKYLYKIDGKATERVVNLIEEMIEQSRNGKKNEEHI